MRFNSNNKQCLIEINVSIFNELFNAVFDKHMLKYVIEFFYRIVNTKIIKNNFFMFDF